MAVKRNLSNPLPMKDEGTNHRRDVTFPHGAVKLRPGEEVQIPLGNPMPARPPGAPDMKISLSGSVFTEAPADAEHPKEYRHVTIPQSGLFEVTGWTATDVTLKVKDN